MLKKNYLLKCCVSNSFRLLMGVFDPSKTGMNLTYDQIVAKTNTMTQQTEQTLEQGSRYHGYKNTTASQYLDYQVIETREYLTAIPRSNNQTRNVGWYRPDYQKILSDLNICNYVENLGVKEVWMWGYHYGDIEPVESNMAGPYGDISNSERIADMPVCSKTYILYNYNYSRSAGEAVHDHIHQMEKELEYMDTSLFWDRFVRPYGSTTSTNNCGWAHMPPNTPTSYDYGNTTALPTRCEDWHPDQTGTVQNLNCNRWGCTDIGFFQWWMQNLPGKDNGLSYLGKPLRNWWDAKYDFDAYLAVGRNLVFPVVPTITPTQIPTATPTRTPTRTPTPIPPTTTPTCTPTRTPTPTIVVPTNTLTPVPPTPTPVPGDITGDNHVTLADLSILLSNFGKSGTRAQGDVNGNGTINLSDLSIVLSNFGK